MRKGKKKLFQELKESLRKSGVKKFHKYLTESDTQSGVEIYRLKPVTYSGREASKETVEYFFEEISELFQELRGRENVMDVGVQQDFLYLEEIFNTSYDFYKQITTGEPSKGRYFLRLPSGVYEKIGDIIERNENEGNIGKKVAFLGRRLRYMLIFIFRSIKRDTEPDELPSYRRREEERRKTGEGRFGQEGKALDIKF